jgi:outer membrane protein OmpA-like peptidoglycan-associated protein/tetratricopeptide (TPR) repeat protein
MKNLFIPILLFIGISINLNAQENAQIESSQDRNINYLKYSNVKAIEKSNKELKGDKYSFRYSFDKAIDKYSNTKELSVEGQRKLAESYYNIGKNIEAEEAYSKLISTPAVILPEDYYNYAMVLKSNGKYDEANKWMVRFKELKPNDLRIRGYNANYENQSNLLKEDGKYKIYHLDVNTDADDFGTSYYKEQVVFSSTKLKPKMILKKYNWNGKPFWNMYVSKVEDGQLKKPKNFNRGLNGNMHDGPASFSNDGNFMAFTRNNYKDKTKDKIVELQIFFSSNTDGKWSEEVPFILNNSEYSVGQPFLKADGKTMYFTSDMPGGFGGSDIYKVSKNEQGEWGKAENLGDKINTEGDEMYPFFEEKNEILFFTSNGHFGLGGLDIFISPMNGLEFGPVYNAGFPLNTQYDDFAVIVNKDLNKGYFSSSRTNGSGGDDIYALDILKGFDIGKKLIGIAKDTSEIPVAGAFITLIDNQSYVLDTITTGNDAAFSFLVKSNSEFKLFGQKESYIDGDSVANTFGKEFIVKADVILLKKEEIITPKTVAEKIEVGKDLAVILEFDPKTIYFDYGKYNIRQDAIANLNEIVKVMNEYPDMVIELGSHTDCRGTEEFNQRLSDNRAKASANYVKTRITKPERIYGKGYGETKLVNGCSCEGDVKSTCSEEDHQNNRRTEFIIIKK